MQWSAFVGEPLFPSTAVPVADCPEEGFKIVVVDRDIDEPPLSRVRDALDSVCNGEDSMFSLIITCPTVSNKTIKGSNILNEINFNYEKLKFLTCTSSENHTVQCTVYTVGTSMYRNR